MTPNEARKRAGLKSIAGGEKLREAKAKADTTPDATSDTSGDTSGEQNDTDRLQEAA